MATRRKASVSKAQQQADERLYQWSMTIAKTDNGYLIKTGYGEDTAWQVVQEDDMDELKAHQELLWSVMEYFNFQGSKHDSERIFIKREKQNED